MFLFIFESIGTSELILVGIIALIFLGPRKLPEIARKIGKITSEFRGTANEFKETWQREVDFEVETNAIDEETVARETISAAESREAPAVREIDPSAIGKLTQTPAEAIEESPAINTNDKQNWL